MNILKRFERPHKPLSMLNYHNELVASWLIVIMGDTVDTELNNDPAKQSTANLTQF